MRGEGGQVLLLAALASAVPLVLLFLAVGVSVLVAARAQLSQATDAAALAVLRTGSVRLMLRVSYVEYRCQELLASTACAAVPGQTQESAGPRAFLEAAAGPFGALPAWAAAAGCVGTSWPPANHLPGDYRICTSQSVLHAVPVMPVAAAAQAVAMRWLNAGLSVSGLLTAPRVVAIVPGGAGQVTVTTTALLRPDLPVIRRIEASATAWPGR